MSITVIFVYIVTDINKLSFLGNNIIDFINNINSNILYGIIFIPLYIFEVLSLYSYLKFLKTYDSNKKVVLPPINISLKPKTTFKNRFDNFCTIWLNNEFYEKYKDSQGLKAIRKEIKNNKREISK